MWASLCGGHEDEKALSDPDAHWGWVLDRGATVIQTDRPEELIEYLKKKGEGTFEPVRFPPWSLNGKVEKEVVWKILSGQPL